MPFRYSITSLGFSDGSTVTVSDDDIVVLVGPNNAGKSVALREIVALLDANTDVSSTCRVVKQLQIDVSNDPTELQEWMNKLDPVRSNPGHVGRMGAYYPSGKIISFANQPDHLRRVLRPFCTYLVLT